MDAIPPEKTGPPAFIVIDYRPIQKYMHRLPVASAELSSGKGVGNARGLAWTLLGHAFSVGVAIVADDRYNSVFLSKISIAS
jgi:hypothetical protein